VRVGRFIHKCLVWLLLYAHRHRSILGAAGHIKLTPANQLMEEYSEPPEQSCLLRWTEKIGSLCFGLSGDRTPYLLIRSQPLIHKCPSVAWCWVVCAANSTNRPACISKFVTAALHSFVSSQWRLWKVMNYYKQCKQLPCFFFNHDIIIRASRYHVYRPSCAMQVLTRLHLYTHLIYIRLN
jgi:hypothetical protein